MYTYVAMIYFFGLLRYFSFKVLCFCLLLHIWTQLNEGCGNSYGDFADQTSDNNVFPTLPEWSSSWLPGRNNRDHTWEPRPDRTSLSQTLLSITITPNYNKTHVGKGERRRKKVAFIWSELFHELTIEY